MKRKDVQLLLIVLGVLLVIVSKYYIYDPNIEKAEVIEEENRSLQIIVSELEELESQRPVYIAETERMKAEAMAIIDCFPADFQTEDKLMYFYNMENVTQNSMAIQNIGFGAQNEIPYDGSLTVGEYTLEDDGIRLMTAQDNISFTTTYTGLKNVIGYIYQIPGRKSITSVSLSAGSDGYLTGNMSVDFYALFGTEKLYVPLDIKGSLGKSNIFGAID